MTIPEPFDNTAKIEAHIQRRLLQLKKEGLLPSNIYSRIRPTGSQRPRMYGLPKIHKQDVPLRPILSMTGSAQHQLAQWLTSVIDSVLSLYSTYCISDSFTLCNVCNLLLYRICKTAVKEKHIRRKAYTVCTRYRKIH